MFCTKRAYLLAVVLFVGNAAPPEGLAQAGPRRSASQTTRETVRIGIVLGGAVSLGAYEAGVIYEFVEGVEHLNKTSKEKRYVVDVLVGASAGSMTLMLLANDLYFPRERTPDSVCPYCESPYYKAWVRDIDIRRLLPRDRPSLVDETSLLTMDYIKRIGVRYIREEGVGTPMRSLAPDRLAMGMSLANMSGLRYRIPYHGDRTTETTPVFPEVRYFQLGRGSKPGSVKVDILDSQLREQHSLGANWDVLKETAYASGANPYGFPAYRLKRFVKEYASEYEDAESRELSLPLDFEEKEEVEFIYVDGGTFNNEPLRTAQLMVSRWDRAHPEDERVLFLLVYDARAGGDVQSDSLSIDDETTDVRTYVSSLVSMIVSQSNSIDIKAYTHATVENRARLYDLLDRVGKLDNAFADDGSLERHVEELAVGIEGSAWVAQPSANLERVVARCLRGLDPAVASPAGRAAYDHMQAVVPGDPRRQVVLRKLFLLLFIDQGLLAPDLFRLITNTELALGGVHLKRFGGFLNREIREHDFQVGRIYGREAVREHLARREGDEVLRAWVDRYGVTDELVASTTLKAWGGRLRQRSRLGDHLGFTGYEHMPDHDPWRLARRSEAERQWLRQRINQRVDGYLKRQIKPETPALNLALRNMSREAQDRWLDRSLYHTPELPKMHIAVNNDDDISLDFGADFRPIWRWHQDEFPQYYGESSGFGRTMERVSWMLRTELYQVLNVALQDRINWPPLAYADAGLKVNPNPLLGFILLQPEVGVRRYWDKTFQGRSDPWTSYLSLTVRVASVDLRLTTQPHRRGWSRFTVSTGVSRPLKELRRK